MDFNRLNSISHHAIVIAGSSNTREELLSYLSKKNEIKGNPDFIDKIYNTFTIDDAREIKSEHDIRPMTESSSKIFVLTMEGITIEAQNAMLKVLEEPKSYAKFFIIIRSPKMLLPTVRSRVFIIEGNEGENSEVVKDVKSFITMSTAKRLDFVKNLMSDIDKEKKTKKYAVEFLDELLKLVHDKPGVEKAYKELEAISLARKYIDDRSPSVKMLLEYVGLNI